MKSLASFPLTPCLFPQRQYNPDSHYSCTGEDSPYSLLRDGFIVEAISFGVRPLDATDRIPKGSHSNCHAFKFEWANSSWARG